MKSYKFRMYPTDKQEVILIRTLDLCRNLYNSSLEERIKSYELQKMDISDIKTKEDLRLRRRCNYSSQQNNLPKFKLEHSEYNDVYGQVLQDVLRRLDKSYQNFFRRVKNGENPGFPRFKSRDRYDSFTYTQYDNHNGSSHRFKMLKIKDEIYVELPKIGRIKIIKHRLMEGKTKTCTIKRDINQWYVTFTNEINKVIEQVPVINIVGIDVGLKTFLTLSNGEQIDSPKYLLESEKRLSREQRKLSRKKFRELEITDRKTNKPKKIKIPTKNRTKQRVEVAKVHRKIRNQRRDFNHKTSRKLVNEHDLIIFEDLDIKNMMMNSHSIRNKNISDVAWYQLQMFTKYKAVEAGKRTIFVEAKNTSQECCICGNIEHMTLLDRIFRCSKCGNVMDRDHNSSIVIENRGIAIMNKYVPYGTVGEFTPVERRLYETGRLIPLG